MAAVMSLEAALAVFVFGGLSLGPAAIQHCDLRPGGGAGRFTGGCGRPWGENVTMTLAKAGAVSSGRWRPGVDPADVWAGELKEGADTSRVELERYADGAAILRTDYGWFIVSALRSDTASLTFDFDPAREAAPSNLDREIVRLADAILSDASVWNRADDRNCPAAATKWSIYCAMIRATTEIAGAPHHRRPAMQVVRQIIDKRSVGRNYPHRLMFYNNDPRTTEADLRSLFAEALARMAR